MLERGARIARREDRAYWAIRERWATPRGGMPRPGVRWGITRPGD